MDADGIDVPQHHQYGAADGNVCMKVLRELLHGPGHGRGIALVISAAVAPVGQE